MPEQHISIASEGRPPVQRRAAHLSNLLRSHFPAGNQGWRRGHVGRKTGRQLPSCLQRCVQLNCQMEVFCHKRTKAQTQAPSFLRVPFPPASALCRCICSLERELGVLWTPRPALPNFKAISSSEAPNHIMTEVNFHTRTFR